MIGVAADEEAEINAVACDTVADEEGAEEAEFDSIADVVVPLDEETSVLSVDDGTRTTLDDGKLV